MQYRHIVLLAVCVAVANFLLEIAGAYTYHYVRDNFNIGRYVTKDITVCVVKDSQETPEIWLADTTCTSEKTAKIITTTIALAEEPEPGDRWVCAQKRYQVFWLIEVPWDRVTEPCYEITWMSEPN